MHCLYVVGRQRGMVEWITWLSLAPLRRGPPLCRLSCAVQMKFTPSYQLLSCVGETTHPLHVKPSFKAQKYISQLKVYKIDNFKLVHNHSNKGGLVCFMIKVNFQRTMNADWNARYCGYRSLLVSTLLRRHQKGTISAVGFSIKPSA